MLGLVPDEDTLEAQLDLIADVDECLVQPIEYMGLDAIDLGYRADWQAPTKEATK
jgi:hypothetical protein